MNVMRGLDHSFEQMGNALNKPARAFSSSKKKGVRAPELVGTGVFLLGLGLTYASLTGDTPSALARYAAVGTGISLALSMLIELNQRWENLLRADIVGLVALYFLIFVEFLFPQPYFDAMVGSPQKIERGIDVCLCAFAALSIGRHCISQLWSDAGHAIISPAGGTSSVSRACYWWSSQDSDCNFPARRR